MKINNVQIRLQKIINKAIFWPRKYFLLAVVRTRFLVLYYNKGQRADRTLEDHVLTEEEEERGGTLVFTLAVLVVMVVVLSLQ